MTEKLEKIRNYCNDCDGEGDVSECCNGYVDDKRCLSCGRFCKIEVCHNCEGYGYQEFSLDDEVDVFVCAWSEEYLIDALFKPKGRDMESKTFTGVILELPDIWHAIVKIDKKKINIKVEDLSIR